MATDPPGITPIPRYASLRLYIAQQYQLYERVETDAVPHHAFVDSVHSFARFRKGAKYITVSEVTPDRIFRVITSTPTTADMTVITPGGLAVFYLHWTPKKIALASHRITRANLDGKEQGNVCPSVGCTKKSVFSVERTTNFLGELCDVMCPSLWRNVADGGVQILVLEWDHMLSIQAVHELCSVVKCDRFWS